MIMKARRHHDECVLSDSPSQAGMQPPVKGEFPVHWPGLPGRLPGPICTPYLYASRPDKGFDCSIHLYIYYFDDYQVFCWLTFGREISMENASRYLILFQDRSSVDCGLWAGGTNGEEQLFLFTPLRGKPRVVITPLMIIIKRGL